VPCGPRPAPPGGCTRTRPDWNDVGHRARASGASEAQGPSKVRQLKPPGFLALNYGVQTPISAMAAHIVFGAILGAFYTVPGP